MENGNGHRRMNFYHKKSSRIGRSSSMERPGKYSSSIVSAELVEDDYKLTDDILYENKTKYKFQDDSHDTILLNKYPTNNNLENYISSSQNFLDVLEKSKKYFSRREDIDIQIIDNNKLKYENQKKLVHEIQFLNDEYKKEKLKYKELLEKINQKKLRENIYPNCTNNSDISPEELKKNKEYISYLENTIGKLEKENNELILLLNSKRHESENHNTNNYEEEQYYKFFIKKEINRLKELLTEFNNHTHAKFFSFNDLENNFTKESKQNNNDKSDKNLSFYNNKLIKAGMENPPEKQIINNINNINNSKYVYPKNILKQKKDFSIQDNNLNNNKIGINERIPSITNNEFFGNITSHSGKNNNQKMKSKLNYGNQINNNKNSSLKSQRAGSKKKK